MSKRYWKEAASKANTNTKEIKNIYAQHNKDKRCACLICTNVRVSTQKKVQKAPQLQMQTK